MTPQEKQRAAQAAYQEAVAEAKFCCSLLKKKDKTTREVELMVFLRPKVIRSPEDGQDLLDEINRKAPRMQKWEQDSLPKNVH